MKKAELMTIIETTPITLVPIDFKDRYNDIPQEKTANKNQITYPHFEARID